MERENVQQEWQNSAECENILQQFSNIKTSGRKLFGILELPVVHTSGEEVCYKVLLLGKSGVGKTWSVARLAGIASNIGASYQTYETIGIRVTDIYWPIKIRDKIVLFKLRVWDPGSNSFKKYKHVSHACQDKADMHILFFSYNDANSLNELIPLINKYGRKDEENSPGLLAVGTRNLTKIEITKAQLQEFQLKNNILILCLPAVTTTTNEQFIILPILNTICEKLWLRDQQYIINQNIQV